MKYPGMPKRRESLTITKTSLKLAKGMVLLKNHSNTVEKSLIFLKVLIYLSRCIK